MPPINYEPLKSVNERHGRSLSDGSVLESVEDLLSGSKRQTDEAWNDFALYNDWKITGPNSADKTLPPSLIDIGIEVTGSDVISGLLGKLQFELFVQRIGNYNYKEDVSNFTILRIVAPESFPSVLIFPKKSKKLLQVNTMGMKQLELEGDFNNYFSVSIPQDQELEDLELLTPDVMEWLVKNEFDFVFQIAFSYLYVYGHGDLRSEKSIKQLLEAGVGFYHFAERNLPTNEDRLEQGDGTFDAPISKT